METVRVRFAPSPTGYLHIGGLRTALFNYLFARAQGGRFILRIEDTDRARLVPDSLQDIMACLRWCGLRWDEGPECGGDRGPYVQSERQSLYREQVARLVEAGNAYPCFCTSERLEQMRAAQKEAGQDQRYDRSCRGLDPAQAAQRQAAGEAHVIRFRTPLDGETVFRDQLRGEVRFSNAQLDDFVLLKSDGFPTYHLANIVDDHAMEISHVLRGEEWISSTPKHVLLYAACGWEAPVFVHLPVIRSPRGGKLSKRDGDVSVRDFIERGYLPEAMINFLALLGWSLDDSSEVFSLAELEKVFSLERINTAAPVFDTARLDDFNGRYIRSKQTAELAALCRPYLEKSGLLQPGDNDGQHKLERIIPLVQERLVLLSDVVEWTSYFFQQELDYGDGSILIPKKSDSQRATRILGQAIRALDDLDDWSEPGLEFALRRLVEDLGFKTGEVFMCLRTALTGTTRSPGLFETMALLGRQICLARVQAARNIVADMS